MESAFQLCIVTQSLTLKLKDNYCLGAETVVSNPLFAEINQSLYNMREFDSRKPGNRWTRRYDSKLFPLAK